MLKPCILAVGCGELGEVDELLWAQEVDIEIAD